jgi:AcrR family transcriptional regulator
MDSVHINTTMTGKAASPPVRSTYRHGDLRRALINAGVELARTGGPDAVVLREATRRAGVAPNAAYRHFASRLDLLLAVRVMAVAEVAIAMEGEMSRLPRRGTPAQRARARVRAVGAGYLRFARAEPGLFRTAFGTGFFLDRAIDMTGTGQEPHNPFVHLSAALDELVSAGALPPERRPGAEYLAWSTVHGLALLTLDGPLSAMSQNDLDRLGQRLLDMVERGL